MVCIKLQFCNSPRSRLVFKGTQQSLKPRCSGDLTPSRCIQLSIYCSAFLQNLGGKSSAPLFCALAHRWCLSPSTALSTRLPVRWSLRKGCSTLFPLSSIPIPAFLGRCGEHKGLEGALFPGSAFPAGRACTAQLGGGRSAGSPGPHPAFPLTGPGSRSLGAAPGRHRRAPSPGTAQAPNAPVPSFRAAREGAQK